MAVFLNNFLALFIKVFYIISIVVVLLIGAFDLITSRLIVVLGYLTALLDGSFNFGSISFGGLGDAALLANSIFPLSETLSMATAYYIMYTAFLTLRWFKSFIFGIGN